MTTKNGAIILAAGMGKRMKTDKPKVMCEVLGKPMIDYVVEAAKASCDDICVVVGYKAEVVREHLDKEISTVLQSQQLGTGHAVMMANDFIKKHSGGNIFIACGDAPLMDSKTIISALSSHKSEKNSVTVVTARLDDPASYGRIVKRDGKISAIVEYKDADEKTRAINEINSGAYWFNADDLLSLLKQITNDNAQNEYYLTDTIKIAIENGLRVNSFVAQTQDVVLGANDPEGLSELNKRAKKIFG